MVLAPAHVIAGCVSGHYPKHKAFYVCHVSHKMHFYSIFSANSPNQRSAFAHHICAILLFLKVSNYERKVCSCIVDCFCFKLQYPGDLWEKDLWNFSIQHHQHEGKRNLIGLLWKLCNVCHWHWHDDFTLGSKHRDCFPAMGTFWRRWLSFRSAAALFCLRAAHNGS